MFFTGDNTLTTTQKCKINVDASIVKFPRVLKLITLKHEGLLNTVYLRKEISRFHIS